MLFHCKQNWIKGGKATYGARQVYAIEYLLASMPFKINQHHGFPGHPAVGQHQSCQQDIVDPGTVELTNFLQ